MCIGTPCSMLGTSLSLLEMVYGLFTLAVLVRILDLLSLLVFSSCELRVALDVYLLFDSPNLAPPIVPRREEACFYMISFLVVGETIDDGLGFCLFFFLGEDFY